MLVDMHIHVGLDSRLTIRQAVEAAKQAGVGAICVVEHDQIIPRRYVLNSFQNYGLLVIRALECSTPLGDFLIYGAKNFSGLDVKRIDLLAVLQQMTDEFSSQEWEKINVRDLIWFPSFLRLKVLSLGLGASAMDVIRTTHDMGGLVYWAHPFRPMDNPFLWNLYSKFVESRGYRAIDFSSMEKFLTHVQQDHPDLHQIFLKIDGFEILNGKHARTETLAAANPLAGMLAEILQKPGIGGSDAHRIPVVGSAVTSFPERIESEEQLLAELREQRMTAQLNP